MKILGWLILFIVSINQAIASCEGAFIARQGAQFTAAGDYWYQNFEVQDGAIGEFVYRVVATGNIGAAVIDESDVSRFINGESVGAYSYFSQQIGTQSLTLSPGTYSVALRNQQSNESRYSIELDCQKTYSDAVRVDATSYSEQIPAGGRYYRSLNVIDGYRLWIDGVNLGLETFIIPASQLNAFTSGQQFEYYTDFGSIGSPNQPGGYEIKLSPGDYYLALRNPTDEQMPVTYTIELFQITETVVDQENTDEDGNTIPPSPDLTVSGMTFEGQSSFSISNGMLSAEIENLVNYSNQSVGPLSLLWLASVDGEVNNSTIIARQPFSDFSNFDGVFDSGTRYSNISLTTEYSEPSYGQYKVILVVVDAATETTVYDQVVYSDTMTLGEEETNDNTADNDSSGSSGSSSGGGSGLAFWMLLFLALLRCKRHY
ncbi:hypothetical protein ACKVMY_18015 [Vibrio natriegens]|uniref:hypothetical protein n=1 Tax=Vibrio natriegens TaxID=691 RepID=UPI003DA0581D